MPNIVDRAKHTILFQDNIKKRVVPITMCIDGSEQEVCKCSNKSLNEYYYSGKKAMHTLLLLLGCSPHGKIYYISQSFAGSLNDQAALNITKLHTKLTPSEGIVCDAGFARIEDYDNFISSLKKPANGELTAEEDQYNNNIKTVRIVVENVFSQIKRWRICSDMIRAPIEGSNADRLHHCSWTIVAALHNLYGEDLRTDIPLLSEDQLIITSK